jgi:N6-adenosine-specific RNA methylase IME4
MTYGLILADPPWSFKTYSEKGKGRSAEAHYDCLSLPEIKALPVKDLSAGDSVLLLWTTDPFLRLSFEVIDSWGFTFKTVGFYWVKTPCEWFGTGYWTRANPEQCLLATRGSPRRLHSDIPKLILAPRREHSRKPDIYGRVERLCSGPYLELFARQRWPGWDVIGDEVDSGPGIRRWSSNTAKPRRSEASLEDLGL